jgi:hypothetical protein
MDRFQLVIVHTHTWHQNIDDAGTRVIVIVPVTTAQATDPKTGKGFDDTVGMVKSIKWLSDDDRQKIFEGNARRVYSRGTW